MKLNNVIGIGVDCEEVVRFKKLNSKFFNNIFTKKEIAYCNSFANSHEHYAVRYAAKEAVIKALSNSKIKLFFNQIEILNDKTGVPTAKFIYQSMNKKFQIYLSLTHTNVIAMAFVVLIRK